VGECPNSAAVLVDAADSQVGCTPCATCNTLNFQNFKICPDNACHQISNRNFSNNLIGCILWHAYFYFRALGWFHFSKRFKFYFEILFWFILFILSLKPWFKFEYLNQSSKVIDLKRSQKVDLILSYFKIQFKFSLEIFKI
jgi:hypothetical protein